MAKSPAEQTMVSRSPCPRGVRTREKLRFQREIGEGRGLGASLSINWLLFAALLATVSSEGRAADTLASKPPSALTLQVSFGDKCRPTVGPEADTVAEERIAYAEEEKRSFARIKEEKQRRGQDPVPVVASWRAQKLVSNAQGAVSFWFRLRQRDLKDRSVPAILRLANTGGGEWTVGLKETAYAPSEKKVEPPTEVRTDTPPGELSAREFEPPEPEEKLPVEGAEEPVATIHCRIELRPFPEAAIQRSFGAWFHTPDKHQWHHLLWTWRSVHHAIYIDGRCCGGASALHTLSRLAPIKNADARLELLAADMDIADLRIQDRSLEPEQAGLAAKARVSEYVPAPPPLRVWADWAFATGRSVVYVDVAGLEGVDRVELSCADEKGGKSLRSESARHFPSGLAEMVVPVTQPAPFPPGTYRYDAAAFDKDGRELARARTEPWTTEKKDWIWFGFTGGLPEVRKTKIIPPFTPLRVVGDKVSTVTVDHVVDRTGLFKSVAAGEELLSGPVTLDVYVEGRRLPFEAGPGLEGIRNMEDSASWAAETASEAGHRLVVDGYMEYDGVTRFDLALRPKRALAVDRVELRIPYRVELFKVCGLAHAGLPFWFHAISRRKDGTWYTYRVNWGGIRNDRPRRADVLFDSNDLPLGLFPPPWRTPYAPYMHIGNFHRGLSWFVDNDRGWVHDPGKVPAMEFVASGDNAFLRLNLVARPVELTEPLDIRFYLLANPFKPLPKDWQTWTIGDYTQRNEVSRRTQHRFWWHWNEYAKSFRPYPGEGTPGTKETVKKDAANGPDTGTYEDWIGRFKGDGIYHTPFINFGTPGGIPLWDEQTMVLPFTWKLHNNRAVQDYMCYWLERCAREIGIKGVYIDEPYCEPYSYNVLAGDAAYIRDDGTRSIGFRYMEGRDYIRRLKQIFTDLGIDHSLWIHTTNYKALPVFTFGDISMDGEHPQIWVPEFDDYHRFYNHIMSRGYIAGHSTGLVGTMMYHGNTDIKSGDTFQRNHYKNRGYLAVTLPFGVLPMLMGMRVEYDRIQNIRAAFGIFDDGLEQLDLHEETLWMPGTVFTPSPRGVSGVRNPSRNRALLYVCGFAPGPPPRIEVEGGFKTLSLGKPHNHAWNAENGVSLAVDGKLVLDLLPDDFGAIWVEGRDEPQRPRPDGVILGVSFDAGTEPDYGGGLMPVTLSNGGTEPQLADGRNGKALLVSCARKAVGYPVVPSWIRGTVQFDLRAAAPRTGSLVLLQLKHHLDLSLAIARSKEGLGLILETLEVPLTEKLGSGTYANGTPEGERRRLFAPIAEDSLADWHRVVLTWQCGQYVLYWDGRKIGEISAPAGPRLRDDRAPAAGVWIGDGSQPDSETKTEASIDSLLAYDWAFAHTDAQQSCKTEAMKPLSRRPPRREFDAWYWAKDMKNLTVVVNFRDLLDASPVSLVRLALADKKAPEKPLAKVETVPWQGIAWGRLSAQRPPEVGDVAKLVREDTGEAATSDEEPEKLWLLRIELCQQKEKETTIVASKELEIPLNQFDVEK